MPSTSAHRTCRTTSLCLKGNDMLHRVYAPDIGFQRGKPKACEDVLILYFLSERTPLERDRPAFLFRLVDLLLDLVQSSGGIALLGPERIRGVRR
ncbi:hypothetical protein B296_00042631 [Ensete ventricosum]|uniref:Uncharacterized protein n=1 Tax=Ensete ventricosum TaxID=4639 RepID=A0A426YRX1_ENSVE|nr:hypothetical protein B296_00042631 [Ensete ventricosum]